MRVVFATSIPFTQQHEVIMYTQTIAKKYPIEKLDLSEIYGNSDYTTNLPAENTKKISKTPLPFCKKMRYNTICAEKSAQTLRIRRYAE